jgi:VWFA-related protein
MKHTNRFRTFAFFLLAILFIFSTSSLVQAQEEQISIVIERILTTNFPEVEAFVSIYDQNALQISGITPENVVLLEDDIPIPAGEFTFFRETNLDTPLAIALLIDTTGSMFEGDPRPLDNTIDAAKTFIDGLRPHDEVGLISFSDEVRIEQTLTTEKSLVLEALKKLEGDGDTTLYSALNQAIEMLEESEKKKVVILITDGYDSSAREPLLTEALTLANTYRVTVYTIGFGPTLISESGAIASGSKLDEIAAQTGGFEQYFQDSSSLPEAFNEITQFLRRIYQITYLSSLPAEDVEHELEVQISLAGESFSASEMFIPNPIRLQVLNPQPGNILSIATPITVDASAPSQVSQVQIWIDGEVWRSLSVPTSGEDIYDVTWDLAGVVSGEHEISVVVFDTIGNKKESTFPVTVRDPIIIEILNPEDGAVLVTRPIIEVRVDSVAGIESARLLLNDNLLGTFSDESFTFEWPPQAIDYGLYRINVEVVDTLGNTSMEEINVRIGDKLMPDPMTGETSSTGSLLLILFGGGAIAIAFLLIVLPLILKKKKPKSKPAKAGDVKKEGLPPHQTSQDDVSHPVAQQPGMPHSVALDTPLFLQEVSGLNPGTIWALDQEENKLGRSKSDNDIQLQGSTASRRMAIIRKSGQGYFLHPLHPENPVLINNQPIAQQVLLNVGDEIRMGESTFLVTAKPSMD